MSCLHFDLVVIGSGPGGYVAAIRAAQLGLSVAVVEKNKHLGGTCLNVGCIPSKALLHSTELYYAVKDRGERHGIKATSLSCDIKALMQNKIEVVERLRGGIRQLLDQRKIAVFEGHGRIIASHKVEVKNGRAIQILEGKNILIATGSTSVELPFLRFDGKTVISSDEGIALESVPEKLVVVGAGAIGLELGSVWARLGSQVTVLELLPAVAPTFDSDISKMAERIFRKQGLHFELSTRVTGLEKNGNKTYLTAEKVSYKGQASISKDRDKNSSGSECLKFEANKVLVSVGRRPYTESLGLEDLGIALDAQKRIPVDVHYRTSVSHIYAIGDVIPGLMLAHKAEEEGVAVAEILAGKAGHVRYDVIPNVIYTDPELASVGISEQQAKESGIAVSVGKFPLAANGRAIATDATEGLVKVIACAKTDKLLGVQILAKNASEMIGSAVTHMEYGGSAEDMARTVTAHPTIAESLKEAALAVDKRSIHII